MARGLCSLEARRVGANHTPPIARRDTTAAFTSLSASDPRGAFESTTIRPSSRRDNSVICRVTATGCPHAPARIRERSCVSLCGSTRLRSYRGVRLVLSRRSPRPQRGRTRGHRCVGVSRLCARLCPHRDRNMPNHSPGVPARLCPVSRCVFGMSQWGWSDRRANPHPGRPLVVSNSKPNWSR